jgi:hypothetical protein
MGTGVFFVGKLIRGPEYVAWVDMRRRCNNANYKAFSDYGGRGIKISPEWNDFSVFLEDMGQRPTSGHSLDRIDNDGNYCKENCKWSTKIEQANNKRSNRFLEISGKRKTIAEWSRVSGIGAKTIIKRISHGWHPFNAVFKESETLAMFTHKGITLSLTEWADYFGIKRITAYARNKKGLPFEMIFTKKDMRFK